MGKYKLAIAICVIVTLAVVVLIIKILSIGAYDVTDLSIGAAILALFAWVIYSAFDGIKRM